MDGRNRIHPGKRGEHSLGGRVPLDIRWYVRGVRRQHENPITTAKLDEKRGRPLTFGGGAGGYDANEKRKKTAQAIKICAEIRRRGGGKRKNVPLESGRTAFTARRGQDAVERGQPIMRGVRTRSLSAGVL